MKKKLLSLLLSAVLALSVLPAAAAADAPDTTPTQAVSETSAPTEADPAPVRTVNELAPTAAVNYPAIIKVSPAASGVVIKWKAYAGAAKYVVFVKKSGGIWKRLAVSYTTSARHKFTADSTSYTYTVRALNKNGKYISSYDKTGYTFTCLPAPKFTAAENINGAQKIKWTAVTGAASYRVYLKTGTTVKAVATTENTYFVYDKVTSGKNYTYTVCCYDTAKKAPVSYYQTKGIKKMYVAPPVLKEARLASGGVTITWNKVAGAYRYCVFTKSNGKWTRLGFAIGASFLHKNPASGILHTYTVRCADRKGNFISAYDTEGVTCGYRTPPTFRHIGSSDKGVELSWRAADDIHAYSVYRRIFGGKWKIIGKTTATEFTDTDANPDSLYAYTLRGMNKSGEYITHYKDNDTYYKNGSLAEGKIKIGSVTFSFRNGKLTTGYYTVNNELRYYDTHGIWKKNAIVGTAKEGYTYADKNGVCFTTKQVKQAATFIAKHGRGSTLSERAGYSIIYMKHHYPYRRSYNNPSKPADLPAIASDMFTKGSGNCFRYATSFAYMAKIAGYRVRLTVGTTAGSAHGWIHILVGGKWIMCDNRIVGRSDYYFPDYTGYKSRLAGWKLKGKFTAELIFGKNGKAYWK